MFTRITALAALVFVLTACSTQQSDQTTSSTHNTADVTFAQQMIPHHQQAIEMARLAKTRAGSQAVKSLAAQIDAAQDPEITTMTGWLKAWGEDVPTAGMDHSGHDMPGMMTGGQMADLTAVSGADFDQMFLAMMIAHHRGAIEMATTEQADGKYRDAIALADQIESAQKAEIATMQGLLAP